jgi:hypothetical protein
MGFSVEIYLPRIPNDRVRHFMSQVQGSKRSFMYCSDKSSYLQPVCCLYLSLPTFIFADDISLFVIVVVLMMGLFVPHRRTARGAGLS